MSLLSEIEKVIEGKSNVQDIIKIYETELEISESMVIKTKDLFLQ